MKTCEALEQASSWTDVSLNSTSLENGNCGWEQRTSDTFTLGSSTSPSPFLSLQGFGCASSGGARLEYPTQHGPIFKCAPRSARIVAHRGTTNLRPWTNRPPAWMRKVKNGGGILRLSRCSCNFFPLRPAPGCGTT